MPGSPQLNSFGPTASDLLISYLERCKVFWSLETDLLEGWQAAVRENRAPNFSIHVCYRDKSRLITSADRP